jgi:hypothetical protein
VLVALASATPNSGHKGEVAAQVACSNFVEYMKHKMHRIRSLKEAGYYLIRCSAFSLLYCYTSGCSLSLFPIHSLSKNRAFLHSHAQIIEFPMGFGDDKKKGPQQDVYSSGTTSLLGGIISEVREVCITS